LDYEGTLFTLPFARAAPAHSLPDLVDFTAAAYTVSTVGEFAGFDDPDVGLSEPGTLIVNVQEFAELLVPGAVLDVEGQRHRCEDVAIVQTVVLAQAVEHGFLVAE
jgi:hypothetical protein